MCGMPWSKRWAKRWNWRQNSHNTNFHSRRNNRNKRPAGDSWPFSFARPAGRQLAVFMRGQLGDSWASIRPAASGQRPAASGQRPAASGQRPAASGQRPAASGQRPAASGQRFPAGRASGQLGDSWATAGRQLGDSWARIPKIICGILAQLENASYGFNVRGTQRETQRGKR